MSKDTRIDKTTKQVTGNPLLMSVFVGIALMIGVIVGSSASSGPAISEAAPTDYSDSTGTPAIEPVETPRNHETSDSLVVSDNSGTVNVGGTHNHFVVEPENRTPAKIPRPLNNIRRMVPVKVPIVVERMAEEVPKEPEPVKVWTRPGIPAHSRLGRTLLTVKHFQDRGVRVFVEN